MPTPVEGSGPMADDEALRLLARSATLYRRGIFCPAELWWQITDRLREGDVERLLDELPADLRDVLRGAYRDRPLSFQTGAGEGGDDVHARVEAWCRRGGA